MAILNREEAGKPKIDLTSSEGNAFYLIGKAKKLGKSIGFEQDRIDQIVDEMKNGDYNELIDVFDKHFGDYVDLVR